MREANSPCSFRTKRKLAINFFLLNIVKKIKTIMETKTIAVKMGLINIKIIKLPTIIMIETNKSSGTW